MSERETWRVVCEGGEVCDVRVEHTPGGYEGEWHAGPWGGDHTSGHGPTARAAVVDLCAGDLWPVVEIVAPGAETAAEAVAAEREACALACDAADLAADCAGANATDCADAIRARGAPPPPPTTYDGALVVVTERLGAPRHTSRGDGCVFATWPVDDGRVVLAGYGDGTARLLFDYPATWTDIADPVEWAGPESLDTALRWLAARGRTPAERGAR